MSLSKVKINVTELGTRLNLTKLNKYLGTHSMYSRQRVAVLETLASGGKG